MQQCVSASAPWVLSIDRVPPVGFDMPHGSEFLMRGISQLQEVGNALQRGLLFLPE